MTEQQQSWTTADLYDEYEDLLQVSEPLFIHYGGQNCFCGPVATIKCFEDNSMVSEVLGTPGNGRVLVVDAGGSRRCAMLGDRLAQKGVDNGWAGVVMFGCIRDSMEIGQMPLGVLALATMPRKSIKKGIGESGIAVNFGGVVFRPGAWLYADPDGLVVAEERIS